MRVVAMFAHEKNDWVSIRTSGVRNRYLRSQIVGNAVLSWAQRIFDHALTSIRFVEAAEVRSTLSVKLAL